MAYWYPKVYLKMWYPATPKGLLYEKSTIFSLNGIGYGSGNPNLFLNQFVMVFTLEIPSLVVNHHVAIIIYN
jgi:hypothetical protein